MQSPVSFKVYSEAAPEGYVCKLILWMDSKSVLKAAPGHPLKAGLKRTNTIPCSNNSVPT